MSVCVDSGNFGVKIGMKVYDDQHAVSKTPPPLSSPSSIPSPVTNSTNNTYITGNLTFVPTLKLVVNSSDIYQLIYVYDYGDNSSLEEQSDNNSTHLYNKPGNYSYTVEGYAVHNNDPRRAYYGLHRGSVMILGETIALCL